MVATGMVGMRRLATLVLRTVVWGWFALGLTCLLAEGIVSDHAGGPETKPAPIVRQLSTPYGLSRW